MIDVETAKSSLHVIGNHEDALIQLYIDNAVSFIEAHCSRKIVEFPTDKPEEMELDGVLRQAILQLVGMFYRDRESQDFGDGGAPNRTIMDRLLWTKKRF